METKNKALWAIPIAFAIFAVAISLGHGPALPGVTSSLMHDDVTYDNGLNLQVNHPSCLDYPANPQCDQNPTVVEAHNLVTETGKNNTREVIGGFAPATDYLNWSYIQLSTDGGAPAATDSACPSAVSSNGLDIGAGSTVRKNIGNFTVTKTFSVSGTQTGIQKVCLHNGTATAEKLMASALISPTNVAAGDTLIVNYSVAVV